MGIPRELINVGSYADDIIQSKYGSRVSDALVKGWEYRRRALKPEG